MKLYHARWPFATEGHSTMVAMTLVWAAAGFWRRRRPSGAAAVLSALAGAAWALTLYFFRDPERVVMDEPGVVVSPGDGRVVAIVREREEDYLQAETVRLSLFLSLTDVHVQRVPLGGVVCLVEHRPGRFVPAFRAEASHVNESVAMVMETVYGRVLVKQIAGILARRCVNHLRPGDRVTTGQRFGVIKFGSRLDLFLPPTARPLVAVGQNVRGGVTRVACLQQPA